MNKLIIFMFCLILLSGCATVRRNQLDGLYPATRGDGLLIVLGTTNLIHLDGGMPLSQQLWLRPLLVVVGLVDLPISICTDTLLLPLDINKKRNKETSEENRQGGKSLSLTDARENKTTSTPP